MFMLLAMLGSGCVAADRNSEDPGPSWGRRPPSGPAMVPGVQGSWGQPVPMIAPYNASPPAASLAAAMMRNGVPMNMVQPSSLPNSMVASATPMPPSGVVQAGGVSDGSSGIVRAGGMAMPGQPSGVVQASASGGMPMPPGMMMMGGGMPPGMMSPPGVPAAPGMPGGMPMMPGGMPGMPGMPMMPGMMPAGGMPGGPGMAQGGPSGVIQAGFPPGAVALAAGVVKPGMGGPGAPKRTEVRFASPAGMKVSWYSCGPDGQPTFGGNQIEAPGRYNFLQAAIYRLKLSDIPGRPGVDLYPTLEVVPSNLKTDAFLSHTAVPVAFSDEDFDAIAAGNYLVKVIYLPFPQYQDQVVTGPDEIVSTRLEPGVDPIQEACKRGSILLVVRVGNIDLEAPNTPSMDAPPGGQAMGRPPMGPGAPMMAGPMMGVPMMPPGALPAPLQQAPAGVPVKAPGPQLQPPPSGPIGRLPDAGPTKPVSYQTPTGTVPTPAQLAGQK